MGHYCLLGAFWEHLQGQIRYQQIFCDFQMNNFLLVGMCHPQPQHQGPKGVGHVPPRGTGEHLQGQMGYLKISWDSQMKNFLLVGICNPPTSALETLQ